MLRSAASLLARGRRLGSLATEQTVWLSASCLSCTCPAIRTGNRFASGSETQVLNLKGKSVYLQGAQVRSFAEAALKKPDIPVHGIHGRYAMALFEAGAKQGSLDKIDADLKQVLYDAFSSELLTRVSIYSCFHVAEAR